MRIWKLSMLSALVAFNVAVEGLVDVREEPALPSPTAQPTSSASASAVVSTIFIQDARPRPTGVTSSGLPSSQTPVVITSPQTQSPGVQSVQTNNVPPLSANGTAALLQGDVVPTIIPDVPATAFFLVLFLGITAVYIKTLLKNRQLRPALSAIVLTFCILRVTTCTIRIAWAFFPENEALKTSEMILLNVGSLVIFMASAVIAKRIVRQFALTSLSGSNWRLTLWWLSKLFLIIGSISSVVILVLHSVGTSQLANLLFANGATLKDNPLLAQMLVRAALAWLFALGALYMLSVAVVVVSTRSLSKRYQKLGLKLAVFFSGALLLETGQAFRLFPMNRAIFYATGFTLELLAIAIYALANLDRLLSDKHVDSTTSRYEARRISTPFDFFRDDVYAIAREAQRPPPTAERTDAGGITIRKSLYISVDRLSNVPFFPGREIRRPLSIVSEHSEVSANSGRMSEISEINFPFPGPSAPKPVYGQPIHRKPVHTAPATQPPHAGSIIEQVAIKARPASKANLIPGRGKVPAFSQLSPYKELSPYSHYDSLVKPQRAGLRQLKQQVEAYAKGPGPLDDDGGLY